MNKIEEGEHGSESKKEGNGGGVKAKEREINIGGQNGERAEGRSTKEIGVQIPRQSRRQTVIEIRRPIL